MYCSVNGINPKNRSVGTPFQPNQTCARLAPRSRPQPQSTTSWSWRPALHAVPQRMEVMDCSRVGSPVVSGPLAAGPADQTDPSTAVPSAGARGFSAGLLLPQALLLL